MHELKLISFNLRTTLFDEDGRLCTDASALHELRALVQLGCICSDRELDILRAQNKLGLLWDVALSLQTSPIESIPQYLKAQHGIASSEWMHVSALADELKFAKDLGAQTCFIPRSRSAGSAVDASLLDPSTMVSDLHQLCFGIQSSQGLAKSCVIDLQAEHPKMIREFMRWLRFKAEDLDPRLVIQITQLQAQHSRIVLECRKDHTELTRLAEEFAEQIKETFPEHLLTCTLQSTEISFRRG